MNRTGCQDAVRWAVAGMLLAAAIGPAQAEDSVSFRGKSVRMLIGYAPGGGTDLAARMVGRFLAKHLPGQPAIVMQNMPGADGLQAMNYMAQQVTPDGLTLFAGSASPVMPEIVRGTAGVRYDPSQFAYIGGIANAGTVMLGTKEVQAQLASGTGEPAPFAQVGGVRTGAQMAVWGVAYLGWKIKWISGYPGTTELLLALSKGEVDITDTADATSLRRTLADPRFIGIVQAGVLVHGKHTRRAAFPDIPTLSEVIAGKLPAEAESAYRSWREMTQIGKFYALPPGTSDAMLAAYRKAFSAMTADPEFMNLATAQFDSDYVMVGPEEMRTVIETVVATPDADLAFINRLRTRVGVPGASAGR